MNVYLTSVSISKTSIEIEKVMWGNTCHSMNPIQHPVYVVFESFLKLASLWVFLIFFTPPFT